MDNQPSRLREITEAELRLAAGGAAFMKLPFVETDRQPTPKLRLA